MVPRASMSIVPHPCSVGGRMKNVLATVAKTSEKFQPHFLSCSHNVIMYPVSKILVIIDTGLVGLLILHLLQKDIT